MPDPLISAVLVSYNSRDDIALCLQALLAADWPRLEITVVDNGSQDGTAKLVARSFPGVRLLRPGANLGFGGGNNLGFAHSSGDILLALNPDVRLCPSSLREFAAAFAADARLGVAGAKLLFPDEQTLQHAGGLVDYPLATTRHRGYGEADSGQFGQPADVDFVTGAALALRREALQQLGGFDEGFHPVYYEDVDLCYRARAAGWRVAYLPQAVGLHRSSASLDPGSEAYFRHYHANRVRFVLKHFTTRQIVNEFLPAEARRLRHEMPAADRAASRLAYESGDKPMDSQNEMDRLLHDMDARWLVREQPFASRLPLLGPLVARFRAAWNSVSTRWYVQPILQQQVEFNAAVTRAVQALARQVDAQETVVAASRSMLGQRLLEIEERVARMEMQAQAKR